MSVELQALVVFAGTRSLLDNVPVDQIVAWELSFRDFMKGRKELIDELKGANGLPDALAEKMKTTIKEHVDSFLAK